MGKRHFNIPVFIPNSACPHRCVFCNQKSITGVKKSPGENEVREIIETRLTTIPPDGDIEIAFFGGSFTGLAREEQETYLKTAYDYIYDKKVSGIRVSTRPDQIGKEALTLLKKYGVRMIELGAQSMDDDVLERSGRGHTAAEVVEASRMIKDSGFSLGLQIMIGLPGDTLEKSLLTSRSIAGLEPECCRIYPALVIKETGLAELYHKNLYKPLTLEEAVSWSAAIFDIFESAGIDVIRMGLHPSEGLLSGDSLVAGPFHQSFRELVMTEIWRRIFDKEIRVPAGSGLSISVPPEELNYAVGYNAANKKMLKSKFKNVKFSPDTALKGRRFIADYS